VRRRTAFWVVLALVGLLMVPILSTVVFSLLDEDGVFGLVGSVDDEVLAYLTVFGLVFADAIVPIFPGETTLTTASVAASDGDLVLALVIAAGALGAILGDNALYWISRTGPKGLKARLEAASTKDERVASGLDLLGRSGPLLIAFGRFVPGVRFAVNVMMGFDRVFVPARPALLRDRRHGLGGVHLRPGLLRLDRAGGLRARLDRDLGPDHLRSRRRRVLDRPPQAAMSG